MQDGRPFGWSDPGELPPSEGAAAHLPVCEEALRGQMSLTSYDRLFPSQDTLPAGGVGNLIAAPLYGKARRDGATVFLDPATMEPHEDQWAYLSTLGRMSGFG
jgi:hypothetical protein